MKTKAKIIIPLAIAMAAVAIICAAVGFSDTDKAQKPTEPPTIPVIATQAPTTAPVDNTLTLSFIGDCILGSESTSNREGNFTWYSENYPLNYFFEKVYSVLSEDDFTLSNMECVLSDNPDLEKTFKDYDPAFWFKAKAENAKILTEGSVEVAGVVNNHTYDYGDEGYSDTIASLKAANLMVGEDCEPVYFEKNNMKIGVVYCNLWGYWQVDYVIDALNQMQSECDYKIVFFHGGEEGIHYPDNYKIDACRELANSGLCDLIVGAHPHVLQPLEVVNNVPIMYSLGNFCFAGNNYPENKTVIFQAELTKESDGSISTKTNIIPCYVYTGPYNNWQPALITDEADKAEIMEMVTAPVDYVYETETTSTAVETEAVTEEAVFEEPATETQAYIPEEPEVTEENTDLSEEYYEESPIETVIMYY